MSTLWVIGDSTLSAFDDKYYYPRFGYGTMLQEYLDKDIKVENLAMSGRSSLSFTKEAQYQQLLNNMTFGDFLLIGFGHNDEKTEIARHTFACGSYNEEGSFANSLYSHYITKAEKAGCQVILCTPIVRRSPDGHWTKQQLHMTAPQGEFLGGDYPEAIRTLGKELHIPVVDMTKMTKQLYDTVGCEQTAYFHAWLSDKQTSVDNTHTNVWGARVNAYLCLQCIKELNIHGLSAHIINLKEDAPLMSKEKYLQPNSQYKPVVYNNVLEKSKLWADAGIWHGTVFGDVPPNWSQESFVLEPLPEGVHIAVKNNSGKISMVTDGLAMYYTKVPADRDFVLTATVTVNDYCKNNQVSFGLMARDDMYIDKQISEGLGDYVAAAPLLLTRDLPVNCFARRSSELIHGGTCRHMIKPKDCIRLCIASTSDGYACTLGGEETITGGFDFKLTSIDQEYVYVGMFVARNADVVFSDIKLEVK